MKIKKRASSNTIRALKCARNAMAKLTMYLGSIVKAIIGIAMYRCYSQCIKIVK